MGIEVLYGVGAVLLLLAIIYGVMRGRRPRATQRAAEEATDRNFDKR
ncbi:MAG TPA: hypothetical protein VHD59_08140 [Pseudolabrys sp.]|jgi:hypothetical protein|nr:hypothetical protein [Pseudolabrys sp.]